MVCDDSVMGGFGVRYGKITRPRDGYKEMSGPEARFDRRRRVGQMISRSLATGSIGKGAVGNVWYQYTTEAMSSCIGR